MTYQPGRHRASLYFPVNDSMTVDFWKREYKHWSLDVPVSPALPKKTTGDAGHHHKPTETTT